jgi:hypothetical protein
MSEGCGRIRQAMMRPNVTFANVDKQKGNQKNKYQSTATICGGKDIV